MNFLALAKLGKALFFFVKEMWLRDRTFRQFVHENLALIVSTLGFLVMAYLFTHVYFIVLDQEKIIKQHEANYARLREDYEKDVPFLKEKMEWYRDRYLELKAPAVNTNKGTASAPAPKAQPPKTEVKPKPTTPKPPAPKPTTSDDERDVYNRWNRLGE